MGPAKPGANKPKNKGNQAKPNKANKPNKPVKNQAKVGGGDKARKGSSHFASMLVDEVNFN